jgi:hypothetical protein
MINKSHRFGFPMRQWQKECAAIAGRFIVLALHRRAGKTELALKKLLDSAVKNTKDLPLYFYIAPYFKQAKIIAWVRLKQMVGPLAAVGAATINEADLSITFRHNGAIIRLFGADNPDAMRGVRLDGVVIDEVAQIKPEVWEEIVQPALSDRLGWCWFIGTPKGINLFSQLYFGAANKKGWGCARYTVFDTEAIDADEVERLQGSMAEGAFAREYLCDFNASGANQLLSLTDVELASKRTISNSDIFYAPKIIGVDPARFGDDRSVIIRRQGLKAENPKTFRGVDNMTLAHHVAREIDEYAPDAVFIDSGAGSGVIDRLRMLGYNCIEVHFGGSANNAKYVNRRTEMWYEMAEWIRAGGVIPNSQSLKMELATPVYDFNKKDQIWLESKDDIKERLQGVGSPDEADALALTFAAPVYKRDLHQKKSTMTREYDPFART